MLSQPVRRGVVEELPLLAIEARLSQAVGELAAD
jgi:hypothetical protein